MAYTPTTWATGDKISSLKMNKLEQGVAGAYDFVVTLTETSGVWTADKTFSEVQTAYQNGKRVVFQGEMEMLGATIGIIFVANVFVPNAYIIANMVVDDGSGTMIFCGLVYTAGGQIVIQNQVLQEKLTSGTNIKTINNQSLLGAGNVTISGSGTVTDFNASNVQMRNGDTKRHTGQPTTLTVTFEAPVAGTDYIACLIFKAGNGFAFHDTAPSGYTIEWADEPTWTAGNVYEIIYRCLWVDNVIAAKWAEVTA